MPSINELFASSDQPNSLGAKFRTARLKDFESLFYGIFSKKKNLRILDVGGTDYFWKSSSIPDIEGTEITLLNLHLEKSSHPQIFAKIGDATSMNEFSDGYFDLVFSNSVIEHLYDFENQLKMAQEVQRVGKHYFIQTPNRYFPVEAHYAFPFAQYLPKSLMYFFLTKTKLSRLKKWEPQEARQYLEEIRLLSRKEMKTLFPNSNLYQEQVLGLTKSFAAHNLS